MTKIQVELSENEDRVVEIYKLMHKLKTKQNAIKKMITYFEADVKPKNLKEKEYFN